MVRHGAPTATRTRTGPPRSDAGLAQQLIRRWGVVTKDVLRAETTAPPWRALLPTFKRMELLGQLQRGYFIEGHYGEQYAADDALELLQTCRGRRAVHGAGYLPNEPTLAVCNRDPAHLYSTCLDVVREDGEIHPRRQRSGNLCFHSVLQAGQALVYREHQLTALQRPALQACFESLRVDAMSRPVRVRIQQWNGYPVHVSPVAEVLVAAGYGLTKSQHYEYPYPQRQRAHPTPPPPKPPHGPFLPYFAEPAPIEYGPAWTVQLIDAERSDLMGTLLATIVPMLEQRGWVLDWHQGGLRARFAPKGRMVMRIGRKWIELGILAPPNMAPWRGDRVRLDAREHK